MSRRPPTEPPASESAPTVQLDPGLEATQASGLLEPGAHGKHAPLAEVDPGQYERLGEFARGGLGRVIRARDLRTGRIVAIKEVLTSTDALLARFAREALVTANLQHPAIVPVYEVGCWPTGEPFYAMKLVAGRSLEDAARKATSFADRLHLLTHIIDVAEALAYAHGEHIIHRDLKPANVLIGDYGETVVIDWGLAKNMRSGDEQQPTALPAPLEADGKTMLGAILGTPGYMAPEQARGEIADERVDVYAIGAMLYSVLSAVTPYAEASTIDELLKQAIKGPPRPIREIEERIPQELAAIVERAMATDREARYPSAVELANELRRFQAGQMVRAYEYSPWMLLRRWIRQHRAVVTAAAVTLVVLVIVGGYSVRRITAERDRAQAAQTEAMAQKSAAELSLAWQYAEQGRQHVLAGEYDRAVAYLNEAIKHSSAEPAWRFLLGRAMDSMEPLLAIVTSHQGPVTFAQWHPGGDLLLTSGNDFVAQLWSAKSRTVIRTFPGLLATVLSPDGTILVGYGVADEVSIWDASSGARRGQVIPIGADNTYDRPREIEFSHDGTMFAVASIGGTVSWWTRNGAAVHSVAAHQGRALVRFSPDGKRVASGGEDGIVRTWDASTGTNLWTHEGHQGGVRFLDFSPDGQLASSGEDGIARRWSDEGKVVHEYRGHEGPIAEVRFSPSGTVLATASDDGSAGLWNVESGQRIATLAGHTGAVFGVTFHPSGDFLATRGEDGAVRLWATADGTPLGERLGHTAPVAVATFSPGGDLLATASLDYDVRVWQGQASPTTHSLTTHAGEVFSGNFSFDGLLLATAGADGTVRIWQTKTDTETQVLTHGTAVTWTEFSPDGALLLSVGGDNRVLLWDVKTGRLVRELVGHTDKVRYANFSFDGARVVSASSDKTARIWDVATGTSLHVLSTFGETVRAARFSPEGQRVVAITDSVFGYLWSAETGELITSMDQPAQAVYTLSFSPDGTMFALGSDALEIGVYATEDGAAIYKLAGHAPGPISGVRFSPKGETLLSVGFDGTARIWDLATGQLKQTFREGDQALMSGEFRPDGELVATAGLDGVVRVWDVKTGRVLFARRVGGEVIAARFSLDGRQLAVFSTEAPPQRWDIADWSGTSATLEATMACKCSWRVDGAALVAARPTAEACKVPAAVLQ